MYLLDRHPDNKDYVLGRLRETLRFATRGFGLNKKRLPIFVYHRNIYENEPHSFNFLNKVGYSYVGLFIYIAWHVAGNNIFIV